ncbi:MAG: hypothetical protein V4643_07515 [Bacteroidota bacterium]
MKGFLKELGSVAIIIIAIVVSILFTDFVFYNKNFQYIFFTYIIVFILFFILSGYIKNKLFQKTSAIFYLPFGLLVAAVSLLIPFLAVFLHLIFYFVFAYLLPEMTYKILNYFHLIDFITPSTALYLKITITVTISVLFNPVLRGIIHKISPWNRKSSEKLKKYELHKLSNYFLSTDNVRFFIYSSYVITLLIINICNFQGQPFKDSFGIDKSILQSFVTFIAVDRALVLMKALEFRPSELLNQIWRTIKKSFKEDDNNEITSAS